jgi:phosphodiesterase/alkaline phosphatase D-like protein
MFGRKKHPHLAKHSRRTFLRMGAATAAGLLLRPDAIHAGGDVARDPHPADLPEDGAAFPLGVAAGAVEVDTAAVWTRYVGQAPLVLAVWRSTALDGDHDDKATWVQVVHHELPGASDADAPLLLPLDQLSPHTEHRFAFYTLEGGRPAKRSKVGRFKTAPPLDALVPVTLGATCCTMNGIDQSVLAAAGTRHDLDALIQMGDAVYADGSKTLADYRAKWWDNLSKPGYQAMRSSASLMATWDDHEVQNDWDPESVPAAQIEAARAAFFEHMPICREQGCPDRIWRKQRFGRTVEVFVLDCRSERSRSATPKRYLGDEQMRWLKDGLKTSEARFKLIVNSVPISTFPPIFQGSVRDRWETFPEARIELLSFIEGEDIPGVLFVSGDFHLAMIGRASLHGVGSRTLEVLAGPGAQIGHPFVSWLTGKQYDWASNTNNVTALRFDPATGTVDIRYYDDKSRVFHHAAYRERASTGFDKLLV